MGLHTSNPYILPGKFIMSYKISHFVLHSQTLIHSQGSIRFWYFLFSQFLTLYWLTYSPRITLWWDSDSLPSGALASCRVCLYNVINKTTWGTLSSLIEPASRHHGTQVWAPYSLAEDGVFADTHVACRGPADQSWIESMTHWLLTGTVFIIHPKQ